MPRQLFLELDSIGVRAMAGSKWDFDTTTDKDAPDVLRPKLVEELADQFGVRSGLLVVCIAFFIVGITVLSSASFEEFRLLERGAARHACYDGLRKELMKPPAKGADIPRG